jgi:UDP-N-acetyl-D-mannosaminuronate dehydrogenase
MGLPIACHLASHGASVTACDNDPVRVDAINAGRMPFFEPGVEKLLAAARHRNLIEATTSLDCALNDAHVVIVIVPVLVDEERRPDLRTITDVTTSIAKLLPY